MPAPPLSDIAPMQPQEVVHPFDDSAWCFELKHDGYRLLAETAPSVKLATRNGSEATYRFPELHAPLESLGGRHILDGEVCVLDHSGNSDFMRLQSRARCRGFPAGADPVVYCVFDVLVYRGRNVMKKPLWERQELLTALLDEPRPSMLLVRNIAGQGVRLYREAVALGLEGVVAKMRDSLYLPGQRTACWLKIKRPGAVPAQRFKH